MSPSGVSATHYHTVVEWPHGLGDGADADYLIIPNVYSNVGHYHELHLDIRRSGTTIGVGSFCGSCTYVDRVWDTSPWRECLYSSGFWTYGHNLNFNIHDHHNRCW
jgi:hypothetical protein